MAAASKVATAGGGPKTLRVFQTANREFEEEEEEAGLSRDYAGSPAEDAFLQLSQPTSSVALSNPQCPGLGTAKEPGVSQILPLGEEQPSCSSVMEVAMAVKDIKHLMNNFDLDLASVTQAFLKNSGEVAAVVSCLLTGQRLDGCPLWNTQDDVDLIKGEDKLRSRLIAKYGAESVTRRMAFRNS